MRLFGLVFSLILPWSSAQAAQDSSPSDVDDMPLRMAFRVDDAPVKWLDLSVNPEKPQTVEIGGGYTLTTSWDSNSKSARTVLTGPNGNEMHRRNSTPENGELTSAAYVICNGQVLHMSPARLEIPDCNR